MKTLTHEPATNGQIRQITRVGTDAVEKTIEKFGLDKAGAQRVHARGGEFTRAICKEVVALLKELSISDCYIEEEEPSDRMYPKEYEGPNPIEEQIKAVAEIFEFDPTQALEYVQNLPEFPEGAEGWFAIPKVDALAKKHFLFKKKCNTVEQYCRAVEVVHKKIADTRAFSTYHDVLKYQSSWLQVHTRTVQALATLAENQPGDILIIAAQLGMSHRGRSIRRARECFVSNEFGLTSLIVGSVILTHPSRLVGWEELYMDCAGDESDVLFADDRFDHASEFDFGGGKVSFGSKKVDSASAFYGSASGFVPTS